MQAPRWHGRLGRRADLVELNEAVASQSLVALRELGVGPRRSTSTVVRSPIGRQLGISGLVGLVVTLLHELRRREGGYGVVTIGVGQGQAVLLERA